MKHLRTLLAPCRGALLISVLTALCCGCSSAPPLTEQEMAKLHPQVQRLVSGEVVADLEQASTLRSDGSRAYDLIVRTTNPDELRTVGVKPQSQFGEILTVQVTVEEILGLARLPSLVAIEPGSKNYPQ